MSDKSHVGMMQCWYCWESSGILLDKRMRKSITPGPVVYNMEPCSKCKEWMKKGVILISMRDGEGEKIAEAQKKFQQEHGGYAHTRPRKGERGFIPTPYRTGCMAVVKQEFIEAVFADEDAIRNQGVKARWLLIEDQAWDALKLPRKETLEKPTVKSGPHQDKALPIIKPEEDESGDDQLKHPGRK